MLNSKSPASTEVQQSTNVDGEFRQAQLEQNPMLCAVITKNLPNKRCVLNNYIGTPLEARNVGSRYIQLKLKKYTNWFSVPIDYVSIL
jgi:hypothetical protein